VTSSAPQTRTRNFFVAEVSGSSIFKVAAFIPSPGQE